MFETFVICFREGTEALLIIAVAASYFTKRGHAGMLPPLYLGTCAGILASATLARILMNVGGLGSLWEAALALVALGLVLACLGPLARGTQGLQKSLANGFDQATRLPRPVGSVLVFAAAFLLVGREGTEAATMIASLAQSRPTFGLAAAGLSGVAAAAILAAAWQRWGTRIELGRFFRATRAFLVIFAIQLAIYTFHEFTEANALPGVDNDYWHLVSEPYGPDGPFGHLLTYAMIAVPGAILLAMSFGFERNTRRG